MTTPTITPTSPDWHAVLSYSVDLDLMEGRAHAASEAARTGARDEADQHLLVCQLGLPGLARGLDSLHITRAPAHLVPELVGLLERRDALLATVAELQRAQG